MRQKIIDRKILDLASNTSNYGLKNKSKYRASYKNKKCGDKIIIELEIKDKKIKKMFYETNACIFCQASASLISRSIKNIQALAKYRGGRIGKKYAEAFMLVFSIE